MCARYWNLHGRNPLLPGYNLTGLPEHRCPECGEAFSPEILRQNSHIGSAPITRKEAMLHLLGPPAFVWAVALIILTCARLGESLGLDRGLTAALFGVLAMILCTLALMLWICNGFIFAQRVMERVAFLRGTRRDILDALLEMLLAGALLVGTLLAGVVGLMAGAGLLAKSW